MARVRLASRLDWKRVTKRKFAIWKLEEQNFTGCVTRIDLPEVAKRHYKNLTIDE